MTPDPAWNLGRALMAAAPHDPDVLRGAMGVGGVLERGAEAAPARGDGRHHKARPAAASPGPRVS